MTQELVFGVLLAGLIGLIWAMTVSVLWADRPVRKAQDIEDSAEETDGVDFDGKTEERHAIAA